MNEDTTPEDRDAVAGPLQRNVGRPVEKRTLPADVARCSGYEMDDGTMAAGCVHCLRRTDRSFFPQAAWMAPCIEVPRIACPMRIAP